MLYAHNSVIHKTSLVKVSQFKQVGLVKSPFLEKKCGKIIIFALYIHFLLRLSASFLYKINENSLIRNMFYLLFPVERIGSGCRCPVTLADSEWVALILSKLVLDCWIIYVYKAPRAK